MDEIIEVEKPIKKVSEKQLENLKKMREKKLKMYEAKKHLNIPNTYNKKKNVEAIEPNTAIQPKQDEPKNEITEKKGNDELLNRLTTIEKELYEMKLKKQIKREIYEKINHEKRNKKKSVDFDELNEKDDEVKELKKQVKNMDYNHFFY